MGGLLKDFALTAFIIMLSHWIYGVEETISYGFIVDYLGKNKTLIIGSSIVFAVIQLVAAAMLETMGLYKITYGLGKIFIRTSQFLITFLVVLNIVFYASLHNNLLRDNGYLALFAFAVVLCSAVWSIRIIDFNYSSQNSLVPVGALTVTSILLVELIWPFMNF